jgi:quercetin dioxygenase-like cupin family protein
MLPEERYVVIQYLAKERDKRGLRTTAEALIALGEGRVGQAAAQMTAALIKKLEQGLLADFTDNEFPTTVYGFTGWKPLRIKGQGTAFGFVHSASKDLPSIISVDGDPLTIDAEQYFCLPFETQLTIHDALGFCAVRLGYKGLRQIGGPVESLGRLKYIDGCSDTLLIAPPLKGDPCFNLLHFPAGVMQTKHTHPSIRAGYIHEGRGKCHTATGVEDLLPGNLFILYPDAIHAFETQDSDMRLTVYHPDSDFGPTHEEHPMLNRTIVDGTSAKELDHLHTQVIR